MPRFCNRKKSAQTLVEFVMVAMIFFTMAFFAIFYAQYMNVQSLLNVASYSAARKYAITLDEELALQAAYLYVGRLAVPDSIEVGINPSSPDFGEGFIATVSIEYPLPTFAPLWAFLGGGPNITLTSSTPMSAE